MNVFDMILTATFTGFGVALGNLLFEQFKKMMQKHKNKAMSFGEKIGTGINKTFKNEHTLTIS